jgi:hypothetical protein
LAMHTTRTAHMEITGQPILGHPEQAHLDLVN